jgi:hypothetical protein
MPVKEWEIAREIFKTKTIPENILSLYEHFQSQIKKVNGSLEGSTTIRIDVNMGVISIKGTVRWEETK